MYICFVKKSINITRVLIRGWFVSGSRELVSSHGIVVVLGWEGGSFVSYSDGGSVVVLGR